MKLQITAFALSYCLKWKAKIWGKTPTWFLKTFVFQSVAVFCVLENNASFEWAELTLTFQVITTASVCQKLHHILLQTHFFRCKKSLPFSILNRSPQCFDGGQLLRRHMGAADFSFVNLSCDSSDSSSFSPCRRLAIASNLFTKIKILLISNRSQQFIWRRYLNCNFQWKSNLNCCYLATPGQMRWVKL